MDLYEKALAIKDEITAHRRYIHENAEAGDELPVTAGYISKVLTKYQVSFETCAGGVVAELGDGVCEVLLRADTDALPMKEENSESFKSRTDAAHTCGHDAHAAMLLGAAKLLSQMKETLSGKVRLMFQPGEETLTGCRNMILAGALGERLPDAAFAVHTAVGKVPPGVFMYNGGTVMMSSADRFTITVKGIGGHGAYPHLTVDPLRIACRIYSFLESLTSKECDACGRSVISVGRLNGGITGNVISDTAVIEGTMRTDSEKDRKKLKRRITECSKTIAEMLGGSAEVTFGEGVPSLVCDRELTKRAVSYIRELRVPWNSPTKDISVSASDDFALIAEKVPSVYIYLSAGFEDSRGDHLAHDPKMLLNEDVLPIGSAVYAQLAVRSLEDLGKAKNT